MEMLSVSEMQMTRLPRVFGVMPTGRLVSARTPLSDRSLIVTGKACPRLVKNPRHSYAILVNFLFSSGLALSGLAFSGVALSDIVC